MKVNIEVTYKGKSAVLADVEVDDGQDNQGISDDFVDNYELEITEATTGEEIA